MTYRALPAHLHAIAEHARSFFVRERGVSGIVIEAEVHADLNLRPTFHGRTRDHHTVAVEVTESGYTDALDGFVLDCQRLGLPVQLFIAVPKGSPADITPLMRRARPRGVGVLEVGPAGGCHMFNSALSLSLTALRRTDTGRFPARYRQALAEAQDTFLNGDPVKGCSRVYDEVEGVTRRLATKASTKGLFNAGAAALAPPTFDTAPWKIVLDYLRRHLNLGALPTLNDQMLSRVIGLTTFRNLTGHKVSRRQDLIRRDSQLRTRFEDAVDLLEDLVNATRSLRI